MRRVLFHEEERFTAYTGYQMRVAYDLRGGVRGKYCQRYVKGTNLVRLEPDVARAFPNAWEVNRALRSIAGKQRIAANTGGR